MATTTAFQVTGMSCGHCEGSVRGEVEQIPGVISLEVSAADGRLVVTTEGEPDTDAVVAAVDEAGYAATRA